MDGRAPRGSRPDHFHRRLDGFRAPCLHRAPSPVSTVTTPRRTDAGSARPDGRMTPVLGPGSDTDQDPVLPSLSSEAALPYLRIAVAALGTLAAVALLAWG